MAKIERTPKGKKKNTVATVFCIILATIFLFENVVLGVLWIPTIAKKMTHNSTIVALGRETPGRAKANEASAIALRQYIYAMLLNEKVARYDYENGNYEELSQLVAETTDAWHKADVYSEIAYNMGTALEAEEQKDGYKGVYHESEISYNEDDGFAIEDPFAITVEAKGNDQAKAWAQDISDQFDKAPAGKKIATLAQYLNTDAKTAYMQFKQAQDIMAGAAYEEEADLMNLAYNSCRIAASTGKVCAVIASGGTMAAAGVTTSGVVGLCLSGTDAVVSCTGTACDIYLGSDHTVTTTIDKVGEVTSILAAGFSTATLKGAEMTDKILYTASTIGDAADGKIIGGLVDVDMTGSVKICTMEVVSPTETRGIDEIKDEVSQAVKKYDGKDVFTDSQIAKLAEGINTLENGTDPGNSPLSDISDEDLNKRIEEVKTEMEAKAQTISSNSDADFPTETDLTQIANGVDPEWGTTTDGTENAGTEDGTSEGEGGTEVTDGGETDWTGFDEEPLDDEMQKYLEDLFDELQKEIADGSLTHIEEEPEYVYLDEPTVDDIVGAWEVDMTFSNISSQLVDMIGQLILDAVNAMIEEISGEPSDAADEEFHYESEEAVTVHCYMNIEKISDKKAKVTMYNYDEEGDIVTSVYTGTMKDGTLKMKLDSYSSGDDEETLSIGIDKMEMYFYGFNDERYTQGSYSLSSFVLDADIDYSGSRVYAEDLWELGY